MAKGLPRMRGDRPILKPVILLFRLFTPHARGSTVFHPFRVLPPKVYPACAGIDLRPKIYSLLYICLPRMRGDRPAELRRNYAQQLFTPHARGSTLT